ncbi:acyl-phosphate glycerol 3-phosphate acyltransferase [Bacillus sp. FJAT-27225]|uniref:lysophospholipid acyltransferase family protein n=1 Tax=Bacillus sp. FJAT-27225 TaxID=1743144 RepID=UPI00080C325E|nr:lysophospholipid acyltransferase family protein [Bacillus sp. FJAT-27225]OCA90845.1 acyl-phosphate glycerol 3-phosphate acyltransferase [Bacillus sp. FJAT-27225]
MIRLIVCFAYISGYLLYSTIELRRLKKLNPLLSVAEKDRIIHATPKRWSRTIMKLTGSKVDVIGEENIPEGAVVFISNHEGDFDVPVLLGYLAKPFGFISKMEVKKVPVMRTWMDLLSCVFIDRRDRRQAITSIREGAEILKKGHSMVIFPEGTRSKGGAVGTFKSGSFRLAKDGGVPIVPVSIQGTADVFEKNGRLIRPAGITVTIGNPIMPKIFLVKDLKQVAEEVRQTIIRNMDTPPNKKHQPAG